MDELFISSSVGLRAAQTARPFSHRFFRFLCSFFVYIIFHPSRLAIIVCSLSRFNDLAKVPFVWLIRQSEIKLIPHPFFSPSSFRLHLFSSFRPPPSFFFHPSALRLHPFNILHPFSFLLHPFGSVSIPQAGYYLFKLCDNQMTPCPLKFQSLRRDIIYLNRRNARSLELHPNCFNPSSGILFI